MALRKIQLALQPKATEALSLNWPEQLPSGVQELVLDQIRKESSAHRPKVLARLCAYTDRLRVLFRVEDRYMIARERGFNGMVCLDSCVELFIQPPGARGYINFEFNALGNQHCSYITKPERTKNGFAGFRVLTEAEGEQVQVLSSVAKPIDPVDPSAQVWLLGFEVPWALFAQVTGQAKIQGEWRANLYKCADESTHPHWLSWSPVSALNFHLPEDFGQILII
jgi:hypothetical protein